MPHPCGGDWMPLTPPELFPLRRAPNAAASFLVLSLGLFPPVLAAFPREAVDPPNDGGSRITLNWPPPPTPPAQWVVLRSEPGRPFAPIDTIGGELGAFTDETARNGHPYRYRLAALRDAGFLSDESPPATARASWFDTAKTNVAAVVALFFGLVLYYISQAERGKKWSFRSIAGLNAIEEAIGRSTEMGKGVLYVPGVQDIDDIQTIASMIILGNVARMAAKYETPLLVPTPSPAVYTVADEVVKGAYSDVGRVDAYRSDMVRYITTEQF